MGMRTQTSLEVIILPTISNKPTEQIKLSNNKYSIN
jgi:hypothetical protein